MMMERYSKHIPWTFEAKISGEENSLVLFWKKITETLLSSNGGFYTFAKLMLLRLLVIVVRDSVITLSAIAYNVNNNLDEVLLVVVYTVYSGNIITRSRLVLKVACHQSFWCSWLKCIGTETSWIACRRKLKVSIPFFSISRWRLLFSVRYSTGILVLRGHRSL